MLCLYFNRSTSIVVVRIFQLAVFALTLFQSLHVMAGSVYVAPKMMGKTFIFDRYIYYNSVEEADQARLAYETSRYAGSSCPPLFANPRPAPLGGSHMVADINGQRSIWEMDIAYSRATNDGSCAYREPVSSLPSAIGAELVAVCPKNAGLQSKSIGPNQYLYFCAIYYPDVEPDCDVCVGNPVAVTRGEKLQRESDYVGPTGLEYVRTFRGKLGEFVSTQSLARLHDLSGNELLNGCRSEAFDLPKPMAMPVEPEPYCFPYIATEVQSYRFQDSLGSDVLFQGAPSAPTYRPDMKDRLTQVTEGGGERSWHARRQYNALEVFDLMGTLQRRVYHNGRTETFGYSQGKLVSQTDSFGRQLRWHYSPSGQVSRMTDPAGGMFDYAYDEDGNLAEVAYPYDGIGSRPQITYHYESSHTDSGRRFFHLTGLTDESRHRLSTYRYNNRGQVTETRWHASAESDVNRFGYEYLTVPSTIVTDPLGSVRTYSYSTRFYARDVVGGISQPPGSGSAGAAKLMAYDDQLNRQRVDFNGRTTCYANDLGRNVETVRVEGLSASANCTTMTAANATLPAGSRKVSTQWHPDWRLSAKVAEPGRITTTIYNGQPDPFAGNAVASCAPATAQLPDGKPIAVVCKQVEQATTDANGATGFSATLQAGVPNRVTGWTYNQHGQVLSEDGPRTDVNDSTTYAYYSDTSFTGEGIAAEGHFMGDLQSITNAAGRVTQYTKYNKHGQVLESIDPNGVVTTNTYDARMRLLSTTTAGQSTSYSYDAAGQLKRVTLPDQSWIGYDYDGAHRQTAVYDHQGNRTEYVLDNAGNRTGENTTDPSGALKRQLSRSIDALGRVQQTTGRE